MTSPTKGWPQIYWPLLPMANTENGDPDHGLSNRWPVHWKGKPRPVKPKYTPPHGQASPRSDKKCTLSVQKSPRPAQHGPWPAHDQLRPIQDQYSPAQATPVDPNPVPAYPRTSPDQDQPRLSHSRATQVAAQRRAPEPMPGLARKSRNRPAVPNPASPLPALHGPSHTQIPPGPSSPVPDQSRVTAFPCSSAQVKKRSRPAQVRAS
jgi:hypothetical protein